MREIRDMRREENKGKLGEIVSRKVEGHRDREDRMDIKNERRGKLKDFHKIFSNILKLMYVFKTEVPDPLI